MRFHRLSSIEDFEYFRNWSDAETDWPHSFGKRTVIYGLNGSGKSTLARLFGRIGQAQNGQEEPDPRLRSVSVELTDGMRVERKRCDDPEIPGVLVFGREYVESNLREVFDRADGLGTALYVLGEASADLDEQLQAVENRSRELGSIIPVLKQHEGQAKRLLDQVISAIKKDVNESLGSHDRKYQEYRFDKNDAKELVEQSAAELGPEELQQARRDLELSDDDIPADRTLPAYPDLDALDDECNQFAQFDVSSHPIDRLVDDPPLADWAQQGLSLHAAGDSCGFCNSRVSRERVDELRAHFDDSYREFQRLADQLLARSSAAADVLRSADESVFELARLTGPISQAVTTQSEAFDTFRKQADKRIEAARELVIRRRDNPFSASAWVAPQPADTAMWTAVATAIQQENDDLADRRENVESIQRFAEQRIRSHIAAKHTPSYREADRSLQQATDRHSRALELSNQLQATRDRLAGQLRAEQRDGEQLALELTNDLHSYFGHRQLVVAFRTSQGRSGFAFLRNGEPATALSEGEQSAVSLLHFLRSLDGDEIVDRLAETCVVIDDPISSFDQDSILGAFGFLRRRLNTEGGALRCSQLIVMTHNFDFYRLWKDALNTASRDDRNNAGGNALGVAALKGRKAALLELYVTVTDEELTTRTSVLRELGHSNSGDSEYYLLFHRVCAATGSGDGSPTLLVGNGARRLLEGFLRWKLPDCRNFTDAVEQLGSLHDIDSNVRERVTRALHGSSHHQEVDITKSVYLGNVVPNLRATLAFMRKVDPGHFNGMLRATKAAPDLGVYSSI